MSPRESAGGSCSGAGGLLGGLLAVPGWLRGADRGGRRRRRRHGGRAGRGGALRVGPDIYQSIGVRPLLNARGTFTIISGSLMLPEVRAAMDAAAQHYVHLDELTEAIGARLAELTARSGGSSPPAARPPSPTPPPPAWPAATRTCTSASRTCSGFAKDEVIIPKHSRNVYDAALRAVGVRVVEVATPAELEAAFGPRTALVYILAGPAGRREPAQHRRSIASHGPAARRARARGRRRRDPDRAQRAPAGGRHARGLQRRQVPARPAGRGPAARAARTWCKAAWVHSAPHHGFPGAARRSARKRPSGC